MSQVCQASLPARAGELLFACPKCPTAVEASDAGLVALPLRFEAGDRPWWQLGGTARIKHFSATRPAQTPFGAVASNGQSLEVHFLVPADARPIAEAYRAALSASGSRQPRESSGGQRSGAVRGGVYSGRAADQIARQVLLTLVARADGKIHLIQFDLDLPDPSIVIRVR